MSVTLATCEQVCGIAITLIAMQLSKSSILQDPKTVLYVRIAFVICTLIQLFLAFYIKYLINARNQTRKFKILPEASFMGLLENEPQEEREITYREYDNSECIKTIRSLFYQVAFCGFLTLKFGAIQPLIVQCLNLPKNLVLSPLYRAYLYNMEILRPFSEKNMLFPRGPEVIEVKTTAQERKRRKEE